MKKTFYVLCLILCSKSLFSQNFKFYAGARGDFNLAAEGKDGAFYGMGGSGWGELGFEFQNFQTTFIAGYQHTAGGELIISMDEYKAGLSLAINIDKGLIKGMPFFLGLRPYISFCADIFNAEHYRSESLKQRGLSENTIGVTPLAAGGIALEIPGVLKIKQMSLIPYAGYEEVFRFDKQDTFMAGTAFIGARLVFETRNTFFAEKEKPDLPANLTVKASLKGKYFTPDGDGKNDTADFTIESDGYLFGGITKWQLAIYDSENKLFFEDSGTGEVQRYIWDGKGLDGTTAQGGKAYQYIWTLYAKNGLIGLGPGMIETGSMVVALKKDNNGEGHSESAGNGREVLNVSFPSISFAADSAGFIGLSGEEIQKNNEVLDQVAALLKQYSDYNAEIVGYANNVSGTESENDEDLYPLSKARAQAVVEELVKRKVSRKRLQAIGMGDVRTVAEGSGEVWKNRRVEIYLVK